MKYIAVIVSDVVASVVVADDNDDLETVAQINNAEEAVDVTNFATRPGPGWYWIENAFRPPSPFQSWIWDGSKWVAPIPMPDKSGTWVWDEETQSWINLDS